MSEVVKAMSQRAAREALGTPEQFNGGVYVTKNGTPSSLSPPPPTVPKSWPICTRSASKGAGQAGCPGHPRHWPQRPELQRG